jgi:hypothetical protein
MDCILNEINSVHFLLLYFCEVHFNIVIPPLPSDFILSSFIQGDVRQAGVVNSSALMNVCEVKGKVVLVHVMKA